MLTESQVRLAVDATIGRNPLKDETASSEALREFGSDCLRYARGCPLNAHFRPLCYLATQKTLGRDVIGRLGRDSEGQNPDMTGGFLPPYASAFQDLLDLHYFAIRSLWPIRQAIFQEIEYTGVIVGPWPDKIGNICQISFQSGPENHFHHDPCGKKL